MRAHALKVLSQGEAEGRPPLDLYRTETGEHGEVYIATDEYREWFRRTHPRAIKLGDCPRPVPSGPAKGPGESKVDRFKPH